MNPTTNTPRRPRLAIPFAATLLLSLIAALTGPARAQCVDSPWERVIPGSEPGGATALAYDSDRAVLVFVVTDVRPWQTWESADGQSWQLKATSGPTPSLSTASIAGQAIAYDAARQVCVAFDGEATWTWDGTSWTLVTNYGPSRRYGQSLAYDPDLERVILFGGFSGPSTNFGDTWSWDGAEWTQISSSGPSARYWTSLSYDTARNRMVLFGGNTTPLPGLNGDTWELNGNTWTQVATTGPNPRYRHSAAYDPIRGTTVIMGGTTNGPTPVGDTWEWNGASWTLAAPAGAAGVRHTHALAFHAGLGRVVVTGGRDRFGFGLPPLSARAWQWTGTQWTLSGSLPTSPPADAGWAMAYDTARDRAVIVTQAPGQANSQTWEWNGSAWSLRDSSHDFRNAGTGSCALTYDTARAVTIAFDALGQTWTWNGTTWTLVLNAVGGPGPRTGASLAFDTDREVAVLFGGLGGMDFQRDTWEWNGATWTQVDNPGPKDPGPPAMYFASLCYDTAADRTLLFGGGGSFHAYYQDTWSWNGASWTLLATASPLPDRRLGAAMVFDSTRSRAVLFGGVSGQLEDFPYSDTWEFDGDDWSLAATTGPSARGHASMAFDSARNCTVLFSGRMPPGPAPADTWVRSTSSIGAPSISLQPLPRAARINGAVSFAVVASGGTLSYQWRLDGTPIADGAGVHGSQTATLSILSVQPVHEGDYDVVVTNACDSTTSDTAPLDLICPADFNEDGTLNSQDFFDFVTAFLAAAPIADFNADHVVNSQDFFDYVTAFFAGC